MLLHAAHQGADLFCCLMQHDAKVVGTKPAVQLL